MLESKLLENDSSFWCFIEIIINVLIFKISEYFIFYALKKSCIVNLMDIKNQNL